MMGRFPSCRCGWGGDLNNTTVHRASPNTTQINLYIYQILYMVLSGVETVIWHTTAHSYVPSLQVVFSSVHAAATHYTVNSLPLTVND